MTVNVREDRERQIFKEDLEDLILDYLQETGNFRTLVYDHAGPMFKVAFELNDRNQTQTAEALGLNRGTLRKYLKQYRII